MRGGGGGGGGHKVWVDDSASTTNARGGGTGGFPKPTVTHNPRLARKEKAKKKREEAGKLEKRNRCRRGLFSDSSPLFSLSSLSLPTTSNAKGAAQA